jgi:hypothetical protein
MTDTKRPDALAAHLCNIFARRSGERTWRHLLDAERDDWRAVALAASHANPDKGENFNAGKDLASHADSEDAAERLAADRLEQMTADRAQALRWRDDADALRKALDLLAGLHPCLTTDDPMAMAEAIFEAVQSREQEARDEEARHERAAEGFRRQLVKDRAEIERLKAERDPQSPA